MLEEAKKALEACKANIVKLQKQVREVFCVGHCVCVFVCVCVMFVCMGSCILYGFVLTS